MNSRKRSQGGDGEQPQPTKKKRIARKTMNKRTAKTLHDSLKSIEVNILVDKAVASLKEQFSDCHSLNTFVNEMCEAEELLNDMVEYHRDTFAMLHSEYKRGKKSQMQFQLRWYSYCSAFFRRKAFTRYH